MIRRIRQLALGLAACAVLPATARAAEAPAAAAPLLGDYIILVNNDLGMHCMNRDHQNLSILPPYNDLQAQVIPAR